MSVKRILGLDLGTNSVVLKEEHKWYRIKIKSNSQLTNFKEHSNYLSDTDSKIMFFLR